MSSVLRTNLGLLVLANFVQFSAKNQITKTTSAKFCTTRVLNAKSLEIFFWFTDEKMC